MTQYLRILTILIMSLCLVSCQRSKPNEYQGYTEGELIFAASPFSGNIVKFPVTRGQTIKKGQLLFLLDQHPQKAEYSHAQHNLTRAKERLENLQKGSRETIIQSIKAKIAKTKADLTLAKQRLGRTRKLYEKKFFNKEQLDTATAEYNVQSALLEELEANLKEALLGERQDIIEAQEAEVHMLEAQVEQTAWALKQKTVTSPEDAIVYDTFFKNGEFVPANTPVISLLAGRHIRILFFIPATQLGKVARGNKVHVFCDGCEKQYTATITYISPKSEFTPPVIYSRENNYKLVYKIKAKLSPSDQYVFHPGQPVYVTLIPNGNGEKK